MPLKQNKAEKELNCNNCYFKDECTNEWKKLKKPKKAVA